ncbi:MAG TPA: aldehyde dehydrogenase family protein, partial [Polyangiaceae bacterium]
MLQRYRMQIAGEFRDAGDVDLIRNPFDGEPIAEVARASASDMDAAIGHAHATFTNGEVLPTHRRAELLEAIALSVRARAAEIATLIARESGKPIRYARGEVARAALTFSLGAGEARRLGGELMPIDQLPGAEGRLCVFERVARGPIAAIAPFNFPLNLVAHKLSPALAVSAPTVLKPALQSPLTAHLLGELMLAAGLPAQQLSVLHAHADVAERLATDPRIAVLSFTGSDAVGWHLKSIAGKKHVLLELGGNAPCVIDEGADLDAVIPRLVESCFANGGQICIRVQRVLVARQLLKDFLERFVAATRAVKCGNPLDEDTVV